MHPCEHTPRGICYDTGGPWSLLCYGISGPSLDHTISDTILRRRSGSDRAGSRPVRRRRLLLLSASAAAFASASASAAARAAALAVSLASSLASALARHPHR